MSYGGNWQCKLSYDELMEDSDISRKPLDYSDDYIPYICGDVFVPELNIHSYTFVALFRDSDLCPYFYEQRFFLFDDARLFVSTEKTAIDSEYMLYDLKEMKLSIVTKPNKNIISLTDTIAIGLDTNDHTTGVILKEVLENNGISYASSPKAKDEFPKNYWVCDIAEYCYSISRLRLMEKGSDIRSIALNLCSYDPYLQKFIAKVFDLGVIEAVTRGEHESRKTEWVDNISKALDCSVENAEKAVDIVLTMILPPYDYDELDEYEDELEDELEK